MQQVLEVICPNCSHKFELESIFEKQVEQRMQDKFGQKILDLHKENEEQRSEIEKAKLDKEEALRQQRVLMEEELRVKVSEEERKKYENLINSQKDLKNRIEKDLEEERVKRIKLQEEFLEQENKAKEEFNLRLEDEIRKTTEKVENNSKIRINELNTKIAQLEKSSEDFHRKATQGSMQHQGESFEKLIKDELQNAFPIDELQDVKIGHYGADLIYTVKKDLLEIGRIVIEIKNAKDFKNEWLEKLTNDTLLRRGDVSLLVVRVMPKGREKEKLVQIDNIWVCLYGTHIETIKLLREMLLSVNNSIIVHSNKEHKAVELYKYLSSEQFQLQFKSIFTSYSNMKQTIVEEQKVMTKHWKSREKQLENIFKTASSINSQIYAISQLGSLETVLPENSLSGLLPESQVDDEIDDEIDS